MVNLSYRFDPEVDMTTTKRLVLSKKNAEEVTPFAVILLSTVKLVVLIRRMGFLLSVYKITMLPSPLKEIVSVLPDELVMLPL